MRRVLVTGAGRGLGLELVRQCLERGDRVIGCVRNPQRATDLAQLVNGAPERCSIVPLDVGSAASVDACHDVVAAELDGLDLLINNAGINSQSAGIAEDQRDLAFGSLEPEGTLEMVRINVIAPVLITQGCFHLLKAGQDPKVANISSWLGSIAAKTGGGNYGYCASKTALNMMGRAMAWNLKPHGIVTLMLNPGWVKTSMGGPRAKLTPEQSVAGLLRVIENASIEDTGTFLQWDGSEHPW